MVVVVMLLPVPVFEAGVHFDLVTVRRRGSDWAHISKEQFRLFLRSPSLGELITKP